MDYEVIFLIFLVVVLRFFYLVHKITTGNSKRSTKPSTAPAKTVICVGSGGHTTEILKLISSLNFQRYSPRYYIMANNDTTSQKKVQELEHLRDDKETKVPNYKIVKIPRSRVVSQSYITSIFTTLYSILYSIPILCKIRPDLILCNGPGTCIPICVIAFILKAAFIKDCRIIFIESYCRTKTFSLTGKILMYIADNFLVQWPSLKNRLKRAEYIGQLM